MPTPSDPVRPAEWTPRTQHPRRSIFGNYRPADEASPSALAGDPNEAKAAASAQSGTGARRAALDCAIARAFLYRILAQAYEDPTRTGWTALTSPANLAQCTAAVAVLAPSAPALASAASAFQTELTPEQYEPYVSAYLAAFGHAARGRCPLNEIEYGDIKADPLFQPHRLADLAAFYRAFELVLAEDAHERHDHICLELEFMCVLSAKEAFALEHDLGPESLDVCRDAQKKFLREHLGRWVPAFSRRLAGMAAETPLAALAVLTGAFVLAECARLGVAPGSEDLLLRPVDEKAESMCASCGTAPEPS